METKKYTAKIKLLKVVAPVFIVGSILLASKFDSVLLKIILPIPFLFFAYIFWNVPSPYIILDQIGIKKVHRGLTKKHYIDVFLNKNIECRWDWICGVTSSRGANGKFWTKVVFSADPNKNFNGDYFEIDESFENGCIVIDSSVFMENEYVAILREIQKLATNANLDKTTTRIINNQLSLKSVRNIFERKNA